MVFDSLKLNIIMGKRKLQTTKYEHNHTYNPRAHESDDRKVKMLQAMDIRRFQQAVDRQMEKMRKFFPPGEKEKTKIGNESIE